MVRHLADLWHLPSEHLAGLAGIAEHLGSLVEDATHAISDLVSSLLDAFRCAALAQAPARKLHAAPHRQVRMVTGLLWALALCAWPCTRAAAPVMTLILSPHVQSAHESSRSVCGCLCRQKVEEALEGLAQEPKAASARALGAAVHELGLGCLALKEVSPLPFCSLQ